MKHIPLSQERRFTKTWYFTACILDVPPHLRMLTNESRIVNQHIEIERIFLDSEFFITELSVLAYFTRRVTLTLLNLAGGRTIKI